MTRAQHDIRASTTYHNMKRSALHLPLQRQLPDKRGRRLAIVLRKLRSESERALRGENDPPNIRARRWNGIPQYEMAGLVKPSLEAHGAAPAMDFVSIGETMLRLAPPEGRSLEAATSFDIEIAGAESNVATALARLGYRSGWVSVLPENSLGHMVAAAIGRHGVDISRVVWRSERTRLGIYYWEPGVAPRQGRIIYDRTDSAFSSIAPSDIDWVYVSSARYVLVSGISAAISAGSLATVAGVVGSSGAAAERTVVFDMNYRPSMWTAAAAYDTVAPLLRSVDIFFCPSRDAKAVFGIDAKPAEQARQLSEKYGPPVVVLTCGPEGAVAWDGTAHAAAARSAVELDTLGRGDAFVAGFLHGMERTRQISEAVEYGVALAALKQTYRGDIAWVRPDDLDDLVGGSDSPLSRKIRR